MHNNRSQTLNPPMRDFPNKNNEKIVCGDFSNMSTTGITKRAKAREFPNTSCQCTKSPCVRVGTTGNKYDWGTPRNVSKNWKKYLEGNQADKDKDCPPEDEE